MKGMFHVKHYGENMYSMNNGIQYVNGFEGAQRFNMIPNTQVLLMDSTRNVFYIKTLDASGTIPTIQTFKFEEVKETNPNAYITRGELEEMFAKYLGGVNNESVVATESTED